MTSPSREDWKPSFSRESRLYDLLRIINLYESRTSYKSS
jgi:hypothetical protein